MTTATQQLQASTTKSRLWTGRILSGLAIAFLLFDTIIKVLKLPVAMDGTVQLGYPASAVFGIGVIELICLALYAFPRTAALGAILLTGYLGGAIATHVRISSPLFSHVLFPVYVAAFIWGGLYLRERRLHALVPLRESRT